MGGGTDEAHAARFEVGFEQIGEVERAFARLACADEVVDLVDVGDGVALLSHAVDDAEQAFFKLAAILRTAEEAAEVEGVDARAGQSFRHTAVANEGGEAVDEGGFAHTGIADVEGIVLVEAAEHADGAFEFRLAADEGIVAVEMVVDAGDVAVPVVGGLSFGRGRCTGAGGRENSVIGGVGAVRIVRRVGVGAQAVDECRKQETLFAEIACDQLRGEAMLQGVEGGEIVGDVERLHLRTECLQGGEVFEPLPEEGRFGRFGRGGEVATQDLDESRAERFEPVERDNALEEVGLHAGQQQVLGGEELVVVGGGELARRGEEALEEGSVMEIHRNNGKRGGDRFSLRSPRDGGDTDVRAPAAWLFRLCCAPRRKSRCRPRHVPIGGRAS